MVDQPHNQVVIDPLKYLQNLPEFYGDTNDLQTFTTLVDRIHPHLRTYDQLSQLLFSDMIKSRLKGKARQTIEINCHATTWSEIKSVLQNNFGDRRSCDELFDELRGATFRTNTLDFYNEIKNKLHRLNNKLVVILGETEATKVSATNNMQTALNIFKNKIPEPMKTILFCRNPTDLEEAMDILFQAGYAHMGSENAQIPRNKYNKQFQPTLNNIQNKNNPQGRNNFLNSYNRNNFQSRNTFQNINNSQNRNNLNFQSLDYSQNKNNFQNRNNSNFQNMDRNNFQNGNNFQNINNSQNRNNFANRHNHPNGNNFSNRNNFQIRNLPEPMDVNIIHDNNSLPNISTNNPLNFPLPASTEHYHI